jgi:mannose-6-phosphate isomerase
VARQSTAIVVGRRTAREGAGDQLAEGIAGDRLPVHSHPHPRFACTHLGLAHGKPELLHRQQRQGS